MSTILGFAGRKQSGKNTSCNFIIGHSMLSLGICKEFKITKKGQLWVSDIFGDLEGGQGIFDVTNRSEEMQRFLAAHLDEYVKLYSFADTLKQKVCIEILGLTHEQCYGTDEQKNSVTHLQWENMPGVITELPDEEWYEEDTEVIKGRLGEYYKKTNGIVWHAPGPMTAREVMQFVGTEIFRKMYSNVWVDACLRQIEKDNPIIALICDVRFPNEANGILDKDGIVIQFTKCVNKEDQHESETALDNYTRIPFVVKNDTMTVGEQNAEVYKILCQLGLVNQ